MDPRQAMIAEGGRAPIAAPLREVAPAGVQSGADRARAVMEELYGRYGIPPGTPPAEAAAMIEAQAQSEGMGLSMWANPEERGAARAEYASGDEPGKWEESAFLLDPRTYEYMQKHGRHADLLRNMPPDLPPSGRADAAINYASDADKAARAMALYDKSDGARVYRTGSGVGNPFDSMGGSPYQRWHGWGHTLANNLSNPDMPAANYMTYSEVVPDFLRLQGSGESDTMSDSWTRANAVRLAKNRYRPDSPAPIADLPPIPGESPEQLNLRLAQRMNALQKEVADAAVPYADERWMRTAGFVPPGFIQDIGDTGLSMADPTSLIPAGKAVAGTGQSARYLAKAGQIAGGGWGKAHVGQVGRALTADVAREAGQEGAAGAAIGAATGGVPNRTWGKWLLGGILGRPLDPARYKTKKQIEEANAAARALHERLREDSGVSNADDAAYRGLGRHKSRSNVKPLWEYGVEIQ